MFMGKPYYKIYEHYRHSYIEQCYMVAYKHLHKQHQNKQR